VDLNFVKMHGLGNDFIVVDDRTEELDLSPEAVEWLCDRNFAIGADGIMLVRPATGDNADYSWWFRNSDGSVAEMCGNGIRCFAKYLVDHGLVPAEQNTVRVETAIGVLPIEVTRDESGKMTTATVDMGEPKLLPEDVPTTLGCESPGNPVVACELETEVGNFTVTCVSMGNPHCVLWVGDVETAPVHEVGPIIETHDCFPNKTNVEFAELVDHSTIRLRVWERGVGETLACGTGACAAAVSGTLTLRTGREATVILPGGELHIRWEEDGHVHMSGPAEEVFSGTLVIEDESE
jgi:diaminopimelate epimerase